MAKRAKPVTKAEREAAAAELNARLEKVLPPWLVKARNALDPATVAAARKAFETERGIKKGVSRARSR